MHLFLYYFCFLLFKNTYFYIMKRYLYLFFLMFFIGCTQNKGHSSGFYFWKTSLKLDQFEKSALENSSAPYLYTRFFDVDRINGVFQPIGVLRVASDYQSTKEIIPVIFISNRSFIKITKDELQFLAEKIAVLVQQKTLEFGFSKSHEIQIDCDWTLSTKDDYFEFLRILKKTSGKEITSTLRLHQVKDVAEMGVPPVGKVYLMCYSTSSPLENSSKNSILDIKTLKNYLRNVDRYPIKKIEVALPIYSWGIVTNHIGKHKLINGMSSEDLTLPGLKKISPSKAIVEKDGFYFGVFMNKGFQIKIEEITDDQLDQVVHFLESKINNFNIVYFQLSTKFVKGKNLNQ